jgi:hypothetical protein
MNRYLREALGVIDVTEHGVVPYDGTSGTADVSASLQKLVLAAGGNPAGPVLPGPRSTRIYNDRTRIFGGVTFYFPPGEYRLGQGIVIPSSANVVFCGAGRGNTRLVLAVGGFLPTRPTTPKWPLGPSFDAPDIFYLPPPYPNLSTNEVIGIRDFYVEGMLKTEIPITASDWIVKGTSRKVTKPDSNGVMVTAEERYSGLPIMPLWIAYLAWIKSRYIFYYSGMAYDHATYSNNSGLNKAALAPLGWKPLLDLDLFLGGGGQVPWCIEDLELVGGGVLVSGTVSNTQQTAVTGFGQRQGSVRRCRFEFAPEWAIATDGERVVNVDITDCEFDGCNAGVGIRYAQSDLWVLRDNDFSGTLTMDVQIASSNVTLDACDFREKPPSGFAFPYVQVKHRPDYVEVGEDYDGDTNPDWAQTELPGLNYLSGSRAADDSIVLNPDPSGLGTGWGSAMLVARGIHVVNCRFGVDGGPARDAIVIGRWGEASVPYPPVDGMTPVTLKWPKSSISAYPALDTVVRGVVIEGCSCSGLEEENTARSLIRTSVPTQGCHVIRAVCGTLEGVVFEELAHRMWHISLAVASNPKLATLSNQSITSLVMRSSSVFSNMLESQQRIEHGRASRPSEPFSLLGLGFSGLCSDGKASTTQAALGNLLSRSRIVATKATTYQASATGNIPRDISERLTADAPRIGVASLGPRLNILAGEWPSIAPITPGGHGVGSTALTVAIAARTPMVGPGAVTPATRAAAQASLGMFVIGGSSLQEYVVTREWIRVVLAIGRTPKLWSLPPSAPRLLSSATSAEWSQAISAASIQRLSIFIKNETSKEYLSNLGIAVFVSPFTGSAVDLMSVSLGVGDVAGAPWPANRAVLPSTKAIVVEPHWDASMLGGGVCMTGVPAVVNPNAAAELFEVLAVGDATQRVRVSESQRVDAGEVRP